MQIRLLLTQTVVVVSGINDLNTQHIFVHEQTVVVRIATHREEQAANVGQIPRADSHLKNIMTFELLAGTFGIVLNKTIRV